MALLGLACGLDTSGLADHAVTSTPGSDGSSSTTSDTSETSIPLTTGGMPTTSGAPATMTGTDDSTAPATSEGTGAGTTATSEDSGSSTTGAPTTCGNGVLDDDEECDDGNPRSDDACDSTCERTIRELVTGGGHTCILLKDGGLRCWGYNLYGQLGRGDTENIGDEPGEMPPPEVELGEAVEQVALGIDHTCVILTDGLVRCWGENAGGVLGYGHSYDIGDDPGEMPPDIVNLGGAVDLLAGGYDHMCARNLGGDVRCWGRNLDGELGIGNTESIGDEPGEMPPAVIDIGGAPTQLALGGSHSCALFNGGAVRCWGSNNRAALGHDFPDHIGDDPGEMPPANSDVPPAIAIMAAGSWRTCGLFGLTVRCWGGSSDGNLGNEGGGDVQCPTYQCGAHTTCCLGDDPGELPPTYIEIDGAAVHLAMSRYHTCVIMDDGAVRCWGRGDTGQLGYGNTNDLGDNPGEMPTAVVDLGGEPAVRLSAGHDHTCALMRSGSVRCWGGAIVGQTGAGTNQPIGDEPGEMPPPIVPLF